MAEDKVIGPALQHNSSGFAAGAQARLLDGQQAADRLLGTPLVPAKLHLFPSLKLRSQLISTNHGAARYFAQELLSTWDGSRLSFLAQLLG